MALYVYITDQCKKDARNHSYENKISRFAERILHEQNTTLFDPFPPSFLKKRFERQIRLIAAERFIGEHVVVCFYRVFTRGSNEYETFLYDPRTYGDRNFAPLVSDEELKSWVDEQSTVSPPPQKPELQDEERNYLWGGVANFGRVAEEIYVCESPDWITYLQNRAVQNRLPQASSIIFDMVSSDNQNTEISAGNELTIIGRYFPTQKKLFLVAPITYETKNQVPILRERYRHILEIENEDISEDDILKNSSRAYRWELLCDLDMWMEAESDEVANLALSPEEAAILESVSHSSRTGAAAGFPLFINGRAGSGKSTILQYLFADYLYYHLSLKDEGNNGPLYLTCSAELLERSRGVLFKLLKCGHRFAQTNGNVANPDIEVTISNIQDHFQEFHLFLYNKLDAEEKREKFLQSKYIDYPRFRALWSEKFSKDKSAKKEYSSDISWHVLRTYIKGLSIDDFIDSDEYDELPKGEKSVTKDTFEKIYLRVWTGWYKPLIADRGHWDDQDLIRYLLQNDRIKPEYPVIFADEAQDFTRIELEALFRLSVFSNRNLSPQDLGRVPFAFAGDPFQTLNPTGFRWEAIKSAFVEKFVHSLDPSKQSQVKDLNYHELSHNYRSTRNIVNLTNTIQVLRSVLFGISKITPQTTWKHEVNSPMPFWFERGDAAVRDNLKKEKDITIIVPCELGEEVEFVEDNSYLKPLVKRDEAGVPQNVISPARAKGLEFNRVVLYEFGEYFDTHFPDKSLSRLIQDNVSFNNPNEALPYEYFLNRLYVAASRPKRRLFVVDSEKGIRNLWCFATDRQIQENLFFNLKDIKDVWRDNIGLLHKGQQESWSEDREDMSAVAERFEREGRSQKSSYMLRSAAMAYASLNNTPKEKACKAEALILEGKYEEGGSVFAEIEDYGSALDAFWAGENYRQIQELASQRPGIRERLEVRFAEFFSVEPSIEEGVRLLRDLVAKCEDNQFRSVAAANDSWNRAIQRLMRNLVDRIPEKNDSRNAVWREINHAIDHLGDFAIEKSSRAKIIYQLGEFEEAVELWEKSGDTRHGLFEKAKRYILEKGWDAGTLEPTREEGKELIRSYLEKNEYEKAASLMSKCGFLQDLKDLFLNQIQNGMNGRGLVETVQRILQTIVRNDSWEDLRAYMQNGSFKGIGKKHEDRLNKLISDNTLELNSTLVKELAQSQSLVNAGSRDLKQPVSDFLKKILISDTGWVDYINPEIAGAALERAGRDIDCLQFYENVQSEKSKFNDKQRDRAAMRWVKCKLRQAAREQQSNMPIAEKHRQEAMTRKQELHLEEDNPFFRAEFPPVASYLNKETINRIMHAVNGDFADKERTFLEKEVTSKEINQFKWSIEDFEFEYSRLDGKLNIKKGMDTASVRIDSRKCWSVDVQFKEEGSVFTCDSWQLVCDFSQLENENIFTIDLKGFGMVTTLRGKTREREEKPVQGKKGKRRPFRKKNGPAQ